ncbi:MAG TPA: hypothetical protein DCF65_00235 [Chloroflexi bacterium]|nr:hypothetical protein [Chloroflexota bacterium]HAF19837.1 hypothetical protein [Chloroflexota bacterium]
MYRVIKDHGADHFQVDHHLQNSTYRLVSCNIATPPAAASCHPDLMKLLKSRMDAKDGEGKGRAIALYHEKQRWVVAVMAGHVDDKHRLVVEIKVDPGVRDALHFTVVAHLVVCARRLAAAMNDGDETFYLSVGRKQERLRQAACTVGMIKTDPTTWQRVRGQALLVYRPGQRAEIMPSRSKARA